MSQLLCRPGSLTTLAVSKTPDNVRTDIYRIVKVFQGKDLFPAGKEFDILGRYPGPGSGNQNPALHGSGYLTALKIDLSTLA